MKNAMDAVREELSEFRRQDDYFLAHGASLLSDNSHEIIHIDTLRRIIAAALRAPVAPAAAAPIDERRLCSTDDAEVWAEEFAKVVPGADRGLMVTWFANCAETAKMLATKAAAAPDAGAATAVDRAVYKTLAEGYFRDAVAFAKQAEQRWIPVSERLPEKNTEVLVAFEDQSIPSTGQYTGSDHDHGGWCYPSENHDWFSNKWPTVTHWMPLPDHPHEERFRAPPAPGAEGERNG